MRGLTAREFGSARACAAVCAHPMSMPGGASRKLAPRPHSRIAWKNYTPVSHHRVTENWLCFNSCFKRRIDSCELRDVLVTVNAVNMGFFADRSPIWKGVNVIFKSGDLVLSRSHPGTLGRVLSGKRNHGAILVRWTPHTTTEVPAESLLKTGMLMSTEDGAGRIIALKADSVKVMRNDYTTAWLPLAEIGQVVPQSNGNGRKNPQGGARK